MLKKLLFTCMCGVLGLSASLAQHTVVLVNSPTSIADSYPFTDAFTVDTWGADLSTGSWTADAAIGDDGLSPTSDGCEPLTNATEMAGKIALIDRGLCNFSLKAYHAQSAGAIGCIIINNQGDALFNMLAGDSAAAVTIPVVFVGQSDGEAMKAELANGPVNITIGTISFPNDIGATNADIIRAPNGVMPADQAVAAGASFLPGAQITNLGTNQASNIFLSVNVEHSPLGGGPSIDVHTDITTFDLLEPDSSAIIVMDNEYAADAGAGIYSVDYTIVSDSTDQFIFDNTHDFDYILSENAYCKGGWDLANDRPVQDAAFTVAGGAAIEFLTGFEMPLGSGYQLESVQWYMTTDVNGPTLGTIGESQFGAYVYRWDDADEDGAVLNDELEIVALGIVESFPDPNAQEAWMNVPLVDFETLEPNYVIPEDDNLYFVGVRYSGTDQVFFGFDQDYDQFIYFDFLAPTLADLSYFFVDTWVDVKPDIENDAGVFTDFYASAAQSLRIGQFNNVGETNPEIGSFEVFPSPASSFINVEAKLAKDYQRVDYTIVNSNGTVVSMERRDINGTNDIATLDVSNLPAGQYYLNLNTTDGSISRAFSVQR